MSTPLLLKKNLLTQKISILVTAFVISLLFSISSHAVQCGSFLRVLPTKNLIVRHPDKVSSTMDKIESGQEARKFVEELAISIASRKLKVRPIQARKFETQIIPYLKDFKFIHFELALRIMQRARHFHLSEAFMVEFEKRALEQGNKFKYRNLSQVIFLLGKLQNRPSSKFIKEWEDLMVSQMENFEARNLVTVMSSYAALGLTPGSAFLKSWRAKVKQDISAFNEQEITNTLYALYGAKLFDVLVEYLEVVPKKAWDSIEDVRQQRQLSLVHQYFEVVRGEDLKALRRFKGVFKATVEKPKKPSSLEEDVVIIFMMRGDDYSQEHQSTPGFYVDIYVEEGNRIYQLDGPKHFIVFYENGLKIEIQRPQDGLMDEVLTAHGYKVIRWSYKKINRMLGREI